MQTFQTLSIVIVKGETKIKKWSSREALKGGQRFGERKQDNQETKIALCFVLGVPSIVGAGQYIRQWVAAIIRAINMRWVLDSCMFYHPVDCDEEPGENGDEEDTKCIWCCLRTPKHYPPTHRATH